MPTPKTAVDYLIELCSRVLLDLDTSEHIAFLNDQGERISFYSDPSELAGFVPDSVRSVIDTFPPDWQQPALRSRVQLMADFEQAKAAHDEDDMRHLLFELMLGLRDDLHALAHPVMKIRYDGIGTDIEKLKRDVGALRGQPGIITEEDIARTRFGGHVFAEPTPVVHTNVEPTHLQQVAVMASKSAGEALTLQVGAMSVRDAAEELVRLCPGATFNVPLRSVTLPNGSSVKLEPGASMIIGPPALVFATDKPVICPICKDPLDLGNHEKCIPF